MIPAHEIVQPSATLASSIHQRRRWPLRVISRHQRRRRLVSASEREPDLNRAASEIQFANVCFGAVSRRETPDFRNSGHLKSASERKADPAARRT